MPPLDKICLVLSINIYINNINELHLHLTILVNRIFLFFYISSNSGINGNPLLRKQAPNNHSCNWSF